MYLDCILLKTPGLEEFGWWKKLRTLPLNPSVEETPCMTQKLVKHFFKGMELAWKSIQSIRGLFSPRQCNSLSLKLSLYIWNILDTVLTPQIQVVVAKEKCSGYKGEHAVHWKTLMDSGTGYLTFFQSKTCHSHKLGTVLKLGFSLVTWCCCFRCSVLCMWLYRIYVIVFQVVFWYAVDWNVLVRMSIIKHLNK